MADHRHLARRGAWLWAATAALQACQLPPVAEPPAVEDMPAEEAPSGWRAVALAEDRDRLDRLPETWAAARAAAARAGYARRLAAEGELLDPDAALPRPEPSPGPYRCRIVRLRAAARRPFTAFPPFFCHIVDEGAQLSLTKEAGGERPGGYLWPDGERRLVFLGAFARGRERLPPAYGDDPDRNLAAVLERIGIFRWRLVIPLPAEPDALDVLELIPAVPPD